MLVELRQADSDVLLHRIDMEDPPQPGRWLQSGDLSYLVLQRRHRYQLRNGSYQLSCIALMVKPQQRPPDAQPWRHGWVIGDPECRFNARTPLLRCAVWPEGPCDTCLHREPR